MLTLKCKACNRSLAEDGNEYNEIIGEEEYLCGLCLSEIDVVRVDRDKEAMEILSTGYEPVGEVANER